MALKIQNATPDDAAELTQLFFATFVGDFNQTMFPRTPDVTEWWERKFSEEARFALANEDRMVFLKITDSHGTISAFTKWKRPVKAADRDLQEHEPVAFAPNCDKDLCERFFSGMDERHVQFMGDRPHYYLDMLGVHPSYQGCGLASKLLKWGLERADAEGVETYLSASPEGRPMYEKYGFRIVDTFSPFPGYEQVFMIRPATCP